MIAFAWFRVHVAPPSPPHIERRWQVGGWVRKPSWPLGGGGGAQNMCLGWVRCGISCRSKVGTPAKEQNPVAMLVPLRARVQVHATVHHAAMHGARAAGTAGGLGA